MVLGGKNNDAIIVVLACLQKYQLLSSLYTVFFNSLPNYTQQGVHMNTSDNIKSAFQISELLATRS